MAKHFRKLLAVGGLNGKVEALETLLEELGTRGAHAAV
jgi:hypothetical protein